MWLIVMLETLGTNSPGSLLRNVLLRILYSFLFYLVIPAVLARLFWRSLKEPLYRQNLLQRFGFVNIEKEVGSELIWVHSVSAGETIAAAPLVRRLVTRGFTVLMTTMTPTGRERVLDLLGDSVLHSYAPYDLPDAVGRFLERSKPKCLVIIDTELWPNIIHQCSLRNVKTILVNGRLSARSAAGYKKISGLAKPMLQEIDYLAVQTFSHGRRFIDLGLGEEKLVVAGSIKFDQELPADFNEKVSQLRGKVGDRLIVIGASTHRGEEEMILNAFRSIRSSHKELLLILAPRHPHRSNEVAELVEKAGEILQLHSDNRNCNNSTTVLLLDVMGELIYFYGISDIAIVGGSFVPVGGHNLMEAVHAQVPVIMGPHLENIEDIASMFVDNGGMRIARDAAELSVALGSLVSSADERRHLVAQANDVLKINQGALDKVENLIIQSIT